MDTHVVMSSNLKCLGEHRFFIAEVVGVEASGKVFVLAVCTNCGEFRDHELDTRAAGSPMRLLHQEVKGK